MISHRIAFWNLFVWFDSKQYISATFLPVTRICVRKMPVRLLFKLMGKRKLTDCDTRLDLCTLTIPLSVRLLSQLLQRKKLPKETTEEKHVSILMWLHLIVQKTQQFYNVFSQNIHCNPPPPPGPPPGMRQRCSALFNSVVFWLHNV